MAFYNSESIYNVICWNKDTEVGRYMESDKCIHIETAYKKKKVKVHLRFSEEPDDRNAKLFYDGLKKTYIGKNGLWDFPIKDSALKCNS
ncbi:hypothetical protein IMSAGC019_03042 [Lachnospiraceae bacterium]|nr:hypothetical protein IMSAGC019_03042 [Lachnospiraceae bacterium]